MDLGAWTKPGYDPVRRRRLRIGYLLGVANFAALATFIALTSTGVAVEEEEEVLDILLATEPEPEPEPEPQPEEQVHKEKPKALPKLVTPVEIPDDAPEEAEVSKNALDGEGDPFQDGTQGEEPEEKPKTEPKPEPPKPKKIVKRAPPKPKGPIRVTENVTPPKAINQSMPNYPADAKAQGIQGLVIVRYIVSENGQVTRAQAVRGPAELRAACEAAVKTWRFQPALLEGEPVSVVRITRFPFRLTT